MNIEQLRTFVLVAELGSMTRAAHESFMDLSAVSRRIAQLEQELGTSLFVRSGKTLTLTEHGSSILPHVREAIGQLSSVANLVAPSGESEPVRILLPSMMSPKVTGLLTRTARETNTGIEFIPSRNELIPQRVRNGNSRFALVQTARGLDGDASGPESPHLFMSRDTFVVAAYKPSTSALPDEIRLRQLADMTFLSSDQVAIPTFHGYVSAALGNEGIRKRLDIPAGDLSYFANLVSSQPAFALVPNDPDHPLYAVLAHYPTVRFFRLHARTLPALYTYLVWDEGLTVRERSFVRAVAAGLDEAALQQSWMP